MKDSFKAIKNRKFLIFAALTGIVLVAAIFLIYSSNDFKKPENPISPAVPIKSNNKITDMDIKNSVIPIKPGEEKNSISDESLKSSVVKSEKNKDVQISPVSVSDDTLKGLVAPAAK